MLKGPKRSFVVLVVVLVLDLGVESSSKNVPNETKNVIYGTKNDTNGTKNVLLWHIMGLNCRVCLVWPYKASYGLDTAFHSHEYLWSH